MKATHKGSCQICARLHKVNAGTNRIAKHGYNVQHHYFQGVCMGAEALPYELSCDLLPGVIASVDADVAKARSYVERLHAGDVQQISVRRTRQQRNEYGVVIWGRTEEYSITFTPDSTMMELRNAGLYAGWKGLLESETFSAEQRVRLILQVRNDLQARLDCWKLTALEPVA